MAVVVWSLISSASYGQASAVGVIMLVLMMPIVWVYWILVAGESATQG